MPFENTSLIESQFLEVVHATNTPEMREARALDALYPARFARPRVGDLFAGRVRELPFGCDAHRGGYFFADEQPSTRDKILAACTPHLRRLVDGRSRLRVSSGWSGFVLDYGTLLQHGLQGLRVRVDARRNIAHAPRAAWEGMLAALDVLCGSARVLAEIAADAGLGGSAAALEAIVTHPPRTLFEALQLLLFFDAFLCFPTQHGRMDEYLGDLYAADLRAGRITPDEAERMLAEFLRMCTDGRGAPGRVTIGGRGRRNPSHADAFAALVVDVAERQLGYTVRLDARVHAEDSPTLRNRLRALAADGRAALHDDDALIPQIERDFDVTFNIAERCVPIGDAAYGLGPAGCHAPLVELDASGLSAEDAAPLVEAAADFHALACDVTGVEAPCLLQSMLLDGCIARGETVFTGGVRMLGGMLRVRGGEHVREQLRACARDQRERTWLHTYVCGWV
jgi:hypothetical protein